MDPLTVAAASGMRSRLESLDLLANNIANASTSGFKADGEFYSLYSSADASADIAQLPMIQKRWTDFSQGTLTQTGSPLDVALSGKGFFAASAPDGRLYTRNGSFRLSNAGQLQTQEGYPVLGSDGKAIQLDPTQAIEIDRDGAIHQAGETVASLAVMECPDLEALSKRGNTYYSLDPSGLPARPAASTEVRQSAIENANEQPAQGAVRLVGVLRQFEMLQRAITLGSTMNKQTIEEVAKV